MTKQIYTLLITAIVGLVTVMMSYLIIEAYKAQHQSGVVEMQMSTLKKQVAEQVQVIQRDDYMNEVCNGYESDGWHGCMTDVQLEAVEEIKELVK